MKFNVNIEKYSTACTTFLDQNNGPLTQYGFYLNWHIHSGRVVKTYIVRDEYGTIQAICSGIEIQFSNSKKFLYAPYGPVIANAICTNTEMLRELVLQLHAEIRNYAQKDGYSFIRLDYTPSIDQLLDSEHYLHTKKARRYSAEGSLIQPRSEWIVDLSGTEESIYANIDSKNRYAIRLAERKQVRIQIISNAFMDEFETCYNLLLDTSKRNQFNLHEREYYKHIFETLDLQKNGRIIYAYIDNKIASMMVFVDHGTTTMFLLGASDTELNKKVPTSHYAHWKHMQHARALGIRTYNFGGISTETYPIASLEKLTTFKTRFGGIAILHSQLYDVIIDHHWYTIFLCKKLLRYIIKSILHKI